MKRSDRKGGREEKRKEEKRKEKKKRKERNEKNQLRRIKDKEGISGKIAGKFFGLIESGEKS
jgi:hypothetical protein